MNGIGGRISMSDKMKDVLKGVWQFCMFMFWPRWR